jgi:hypothetical protein
MTQPTDRPGINQLRNLADRAERGPLTADEAARLRAGIAKLDTRINGYRDSRKRWMESAFADRRVSNELASRLAAAEATLTAVRDAVMNQSYLTSLDEAIRDVLDQHGQTTA